MAAYLNLIVLLATIGFSATAPTAFRDDDAVDDNNFGPRIRFVESSGTGGKVSKTTLVTDGLGAFASESGTFFNGQGFKPGSVGSAPQSYGNFQSSGFGLNPRYPGFGSFGSGPGFGAFDIPGGFGGSSSTSNAASQSFSNGGFSGSSSNAASQSFSNGGNSGSSSSAASQSFSTGGFGGSSSQASSSSSSYCNPLGNSPLSKTLT